MVNSSLPLVGASAARASAPPADLITGGRGNAGLTTKTKDATQPRTQDAEAPLADLPRQGQLVRSRICTAQLDRRDPRNSAHAAADLKVRELGQDRLLNPYQPLLPMLSAILRRLRVSLGNLGSIFSGPDLNLCPDLDVPSFSFREPRALIRGVDVLTDLFQNLPDPGLLLPRLCLRPRATAARRPRAPAG